jgi:NDP-sugar pyrophosphorylase family protein
VVLFDLVQVPHYNYVGDSILGVHAHMGAGSITSNVKADNKAVVIHDGDEQMETGRRKIGAMLGDYADIGCNTVLNPGTVVGRHTNIYPVSMVRGCVPAHSIYKDRDHIVPKRDE